MNIIGNPRKLMNSIDGRTAEGEFISRSEAIKTIVALYDERERVSKFYNMLAQRMEEARANPELLVPLEAVT